MLDQLKQKFLAYTPEKQKSIITKLIIFAVCLLAVGSYYIGEHSDKVSTQQNKDTENKAKEPRELQPSLANMKKNMYLETRDKMKNFETQIAQMSKTLKSLQEAKESQDSRQLDEVNKKFQQIYADINKQTGSRDLQIEQAKQADKGSPVPPGDAKNTSSTGTTPTRGPEQVMGWNTPPPPATVRANTTPGAAGQPAAPTSTKSGAILHFSASSGGAGTDGKKKGRIPNEQSSVAATKGDDKEKKKSFYMPPSITSADLLTGFAAPTMNKGKGDPIKALFRISAPSILPNSVKSDIRGCFLFGEGEGRLQDERVHLRLTNLTCVGRNGASVIDSAVQGYVVDHYDGKLGLRGTVVTKMGSLIVRSMFLGIIEGVGSGVEQSTMTSSTSNSLLGTTTSTFDATPSNIAKNGLGKGVSKSAQNISEIYEELTRQSFPVIEVGAGKQVSIVFTSGVELTPTKKCLGGLDGCEDEDDVETFGTSISPLAHLYEGN